MESLQIEGPKSPEELLRIIQRVYEESSTVLITARLEAEERRNALRLREEQDAAYRAALEADQVFDLFIKVHDFPRFKFNVLMVKIFLTFISSFWKIDAIACHEDNKL